MATCSGARKCKRNVRLVPLEILVGGTGYMRSATNGKRKELFVDNLAINIGAERTVTAKPVRVESLNIER